MTRKGIALLAMAGLAAGAVGVVGAGGAGALGPATPVPPAPGSTSTSFTECPATTQIGAVTLVNIGTIAGQSQDSTVYPQGAAVRWDGGLTVTVPAEAVASAKATATQFGLQLLAIGTRVDSIGVVATNTVEGGFTFNVPTPTIQTVPVDSNVEANGAQFTLPNPISGTVTSSGADGSTIDFKAGKLVASNVVVLSGVGQNVTSPDNPATCVVNGNAPYAPAAASAQVALVATSPSVPAQNKTLSSAGGASTYQVSATPATPQVSIAAGNQSSGTPAAFTSFSVTQPAAGSGTTSISNTGVLTYTPPANDFAGSVPVTVTVTDANNKTGSGVVTLNIVAGDKTTAPITMSLSAKDGSQLYIAKCGTTDRTAAPGSVLTPTGACSTVSMGALALNGRVQRSEGDIGQITLVDARGVASGWSLTAQLDGTGLNNTIGTPNGTLPSDPNNTILSKYATMSAQNCRVKPADANGVYGGDFSRARNGATGTLDNPVTVCYANVGEAGGTFLADAHLQLQVNPDLYAGTYTGTIIYQLS